MFMKAFALVFRGGMFTVEYLDGVNQLVRFPLMCQVVRLSYFRLAVVRLPVVLAQVPVSNAFNSVFPFVRLRILLNLVMFYTQYNDKRILENLRINQYPAKSISNRTVFLSYSWW